MSITLSTTLGTRVPFKIKDDNGELLEVLNFKPLTLDNKAYFDDLYGEKEMIRAFNDLNKDIIGNILIQLLLVEDRLKLYKLRVLISASLNMVRKSSEEYTMAENAKFLIAILSVDEDEFQLFLAKLQGISDKVIQEFLATPDKKKRIMGQRMREYLQ